MALSRYSLFMENGARTRLVPFIRIPLRNTDKYETFVKDKTRLDLLSYKYYNDANYSWLILQANPQLDPLEQNVPNNTIIRIPYPIEEVMSRYNSDIEEYNTLHGTN